MTATMGRIVCVSVLAGFLLMTLPVAYAQPTGAGEPRKLGPTDEKNKKEDQVRINSADRARYDPTRGLFYLTGHIQFEDENMKLDCDEATYDENADTAACAGNLKIHDEETVITGLFINADFNAEIVSIEGNVTIVTTKKAKSQKPEEGENKDEKRVTTITCDKIVYYYTEGQRRAIATGNLKAVQKDKTVIAEKADYDREKEIITLGDNVTIRMDNGNEFQCKRAYISATEEWVEMEGFTGIANRGKKKEGEGGGTTPATPPPAPGGPGAAAPPTPPQ